MEEMKDLYKRLKEKESLTSEEQIILVLLRELISIKKRLIALEKK